MAVDFNNVERYRSGHNEAVLKTVCPRGRVGSNPTLSASEKKLPGSEGSFFYGEIKAIWRSTQAGRRGSPGKGVGR